MPLLLLIILGVGEMAGGDIFGIQHFIQALPLVALVVFAWKRPKIGGTILLFIALLFACVYIVFTAVSFPIQFRLFNAALLFGPAAVGGALFRLTERKKS